MAPPRRTYEEIVAKYELEVQIEANALKKSIGVVAQPGQILTAVYYLDHIGQGDKRVLQDAAFGAVVHQDRKSMNFDRVWREICFCRAIGEPAAYFVAINSKDQEVMEELHILAQHWGLLTGYELLSELEEWEEIKAAKEKGELMAGQLRAFLEIYKRKVGFGLWTLEHMNDARHQLMKVWYKYREGTRGCLALPAVEGLAIRNSPRKSKGIPPRLLDPEDVYMADSTPGPSEGAGPFKLARLTNRPNKRLRLFEPSLPAPPVSAGADSRPKSPKRTALQKEIDDFEAAKEGTVELTRLLGLADAAKAKALQVRQGADAIFEKLNAILGKWKQGDVIHMESLKDMYVSDIYALHQLAKEQQEAKVSIEVADSEAAVAKKKYKDAMTKFERDMGLGV